MRYATYTVFHPCICLSHTFVTIAVWFACKHRDCHFAASSRALIGYCSLPFLWSAQTRKASQILCQKLQTCLKMSLSAGSLKDASGRGSEVFGWARAAAWLWSGLSQTRELCLGLDNWRYNHVVWPFHLGAPVPGLLHCARLLTGMTKWNRGIINHLVTPVFSCYDKSIRCCEKCLRCSLCVSGDSRQTIYYVYLTK